jgi:hypothetical protein
MFSFLPAKPVRRGEKWRRERKILLGPLGSFKGEGEFTLLGSELKEEGERLGYQAALNYALPKDREGGLPFRISEGDLECEKIQGTFLFNVARGRLIKGELSMGIKGTLTLDLMGSEVAMNVEQTSTTRLRLLEEKPAE